MAPFAMACFIGSAWKYESWYMPVFENGLKEGVFKVSSSLIDLLGFPVIIVIAKFIEAKFNKNCLKVIDTCRSFDISK